MSHPVGPDYSASDSITYSRRLVRQTHYYNSIIVQHQAPAAGNTWNFHVHFPLEGAAADGWQSDDPFGEWMGAGKTITTIKSFHDGLTLFRSMSHQSFQSQAIHIVQLLCYIYRWCHLLLNWIQPRWHIHLIFYSGFLWLASIRPLAKRNFNGTIIQHLNLIWWINFNSCTYLSHIVQMRKKGLIKI